jgi:cell fate (sporulation/competence/biofilm development) regulator YlbF (YheA/YmcA/DUF963 family)
MNNSQAHKINGGKMDIYAKARELGGMIASSEQMSALKKAEQELEGDTRAKQLMNDYKLLQMELVKAVKEKRSADITASIRQRLVSKQEELNSYNVTNNYLAAKSEFDSFMKTINNVIIFAVTGEEPCSSGNCGSCSGGCK